MSSDLKQPLLNQKPAALQAQPSVAHPSGPVSFFGLFRLATGLEKSLLIIGFFFVCLSGSAAPVGSLLLGNVIDAFNPKNTRDQILSEVKRQCITILISAAVYFVSYYIAYATWTHCNGNQVIRLRKAYFNALLHQDIAWYDSKNPNELSTKVGMQIRAVQDATGERFPLFIIQFSGFVSGLGIGLYKGWHLTLAMSICLPGRGRSSSCRVRRRRQRA